MFYNPITLNVGSDITVAPGIAGKVLETMFEGMTGDSGDSAGEISGDKCTGG